MRWKPNVTVAAIIEKDSHFLVVEEKKEGLQLFNQPAGHLEKHETLLTAIQREVMEETAWEFQANYLVGIYLYPNPRADITYLRFCFAGQGIKHNPNLPLDKDIIRTHWFTKAELEQKKESLRSPLVLQCIEDYLRGKHYSLDVLNHDSSISLPS